MLTWFIYVFLTLKDAFDFPMVGVGVDYFLDASEKIQKRKVTPPTNDDDSIKYLLYTPNSRKEPCFVQPKAEQFNNCSFQSNYETKLLIHGFVVFLTENNLFNVLKDALLEQGDYNVIVVDWTLYNGIPFKSAYEFAEPVGKEVAEMIKFIQEHADVSLKTFHCIGHSLGANICGVAGRNVPTLARITGLDPEGISVFKSLTPNIRLNYTDADFVETMHTSDIFSVRGLGYLDPMGHLDFYPNGGVEQPLCIKGNNYKMFKGKVMTIQTTLDKILCNHFLTIEYFMHSLKSDCKFVATQCQSYEDFTNGQCSSNIKSEMGFYTKKSEDIPPMSKFYLTTSDSSPYCLG